LQIPEQAVPEPLRAFIEAVEDKCYPRPNLLGCIENLSRGSRMEVSDAPIQQRGKAVLELARLDQQNETTGVQFREGEMPDKMRFAGARLADELEMFATSEKSEK
jgi:hypothetical protein